MLSVLSQHLKDQDSLPLIAIEQETETVEIHFVEAWKNDFPWLVYEGDEMFCINIK